MCLESWEEAIAELALHDMRRSMHFTICNGDFQRILSKESHDSKCVLGNHSGGSVRTDYSDIRHEINRSHRRELQ